MCCLCVWYSYIVRHKLFPIEMEKRSTSNNRCSSFHNQLLIFFMAIIFNTTGKSKKRRIQPCIWTIFLPKIYNSFLIKIPSKKIISTIILLAVTVIFTVPIYKLSGRFKFIYQTVIVIFKFNFYFLIYKLSGRFKLIYQTWQIISRYSHKYTCCKS